MSSYKAPLKLRQARAYWRLSAKAMRAGNGRQALIYQATAERLYRQYQSEQERLERMRAAQANSLKPPRQASLESAR